MKTRITYTVLVTVGIIAVLSAGLGCGGDHNTQTNQQPVIGESYQSECLNGARQPAGNVEVQVNGDSVLIVDHHAVFNCCLKVWMEVSVIDDRIVVVEVEDPDDSGACWCNCPFELSVGISNLADGEYTVEVYREVEDPQSLIHQETICLGCQPECQAPIDCFTHTWSIWCMGHWACNQGECEEVCDMETCGDGTCDPEGGENLASCNLDCEIQPPECELPVDCLTHTWGIYCQGHWSCNQGECEEVCDEDTCGDGTCDPDGGENVEACKMDCEIPAEATLESFAAACGECGAYLCYGPDAPLGESLFEYAVEADPQNPGQYLLRATHQVQCIDVAILGAELEARGTQLTLTETFDNDNPVDCYCTYSADILIAGLQTGTYQLKIYDSDHTRLLVDQAVTVGY